MSISQSISQSYRCIQAQLDNKIDIDLQSVPCQVVGFEEFGLFEIDRSLLRSEVSPKRCLA